MDLTVKIKRLPSDDGSVPEMPAYQTDGAAAVDLCFFSKSELTLKPMERALVPTGISLELPDGYAALIFARSGLSAKCGVCLSNGVGVIDSDYRGQIKVGLINLSGAEYTLLPNDRIAQMMIVPSVRANFSECSELSQTARSSGGFGSTGR